MAIKKTVTAPFGIEIPNAYYRIASVNLIKKTAMSFSVNLYADENTAVPIQSKSYACVYDLNGNNAISQAYNHLKTLPEFTGAVDC